MIVRLASLVTNVSIPSDISVNSRSYVSRGTLFPGQRIEASSSLVQPNVLRITHAANAAKGGKAASDFHSVKISITKVDANLVPQELVVTMSAEIPRSTALTDADLLAALCDVASVWLSEAELTACTGLDYRDELKLGIA